MVHCFLGDAFGLFSYPCWLWSTVLQCGSDTHHKLQDCVISGASFLTGGALECDPAQRRSVAVLCMLHKIMCNTMHPLYGALPGPQVTVRVTLGAAEPRGIA